VVAPSRYGAAYGFERMDNLGAIGGPLLAIVLVNAVGIRAAIWLSVIPGLLAVGAITYAIRHTPSPSSQQRRPLRLQIRPVLQGPLRRLFVGIGAFEVGNVAATLLILRASELLGSGRGETAATSIALGLYAGYNAAATVASAPAGRFVDRVGARPVLVAGVAAFGVAYLGFSFDTSSWLLLVLWFVLAGIGIGCVETAEHAAVASHAPEAIRGSAFGFLAGLQSVGNLAASGVAGILWTQFSPNVAFAYIAAWMAIAVIALRTAPDTPTTPTDTP
jgi:MFS family permease